MNSFYWTPFTFWIKICFEQVKASGFRSNLRKLFSPNILPQWMKLAISTSFSLLAFLLVSGPEIDYFCNFSLRKNLSSTKCVGYRPLTESKLKNAEIECLRTFREFRVLSIKSNLHIFGAYDISACISMSNIKILKIRF